MLATAVKVEMTFLENLTPQRKFYYTLNTRLSKLICHNSRFTWQAFSDESTSLDVKIETRVSVYRDEPVVYFSLVYTSGLTKASMANVSTSVLSTFPSFVVEDANMKRGYVTWFGGRK